MRAFEEEPKHSKTPAMMSRINSNQMSCTSAHCHDTIHDVATIHLRRSGKEASSLPNTPQTSLVEHRLRWAGFLIALGE
jgi:hypothetical protein